MSCTKNVFKIVCTATSQEFWIDTHTAARLFIFQENAVYTNSKLDTDHSFLQFNAMATEQDVHIMVIRKLARVLRMAGARGCSTDVSGASYLRCVVARREHTYYSSAQRTPYWAIDIEHLSPEQFEHLKNYIRNNS